MCLEEYGFGIIGLGFEVWLCGFGKILVFLFLINFIGLLCGVNEITFLRGFCNL